MNEQEFYRKVIQNQIVDDGAILRNARVERKQPVFRRILTPALTVLASLLLIFGVVMTIPAARAEVLSWFSPRSVEEYLSADPQDREPVPALDAMIVTPKPSQTQIKVNYVADEPYWREIGEHFSATLGETIFDGHTAYIMIDFDGLSGYAVYENEWSPEVPAGTPLQLLLAEKLDPEMVRCFHEDSFDPTPFLNGSMEAWAGPDNFVLLTLENGTKLTELAYLSLVERPVDRAFREEMLAEYGYHEFYDEEAAAAWRERTWAHYRENGLRAVAYVWLNRFIDSPMLDENGMLRLHLRYNVSIDHGQETETKLDVDLGTVEIDMNAYKDLKARSMKAQSEPIALSGEAVFYSDTWNADYHLTVTNHQVDLNGISMRAVPGTVDVLGIHNLSVAVKFADTWSEAQKLAFMRNLSFDVAVDDITVVNIGGRVQKKENGEFCMTFDLVDLIPFSRINSIQTVTLTPTISWLSAAEIFDDSGTLLETIPLGPTDTFEEGTLEPGASVSYRSERVEYPEWTITLTVN